MNLRPGQAFINGHSSERARLIMDACANVGVNTAEVRTTDSGFIVPEEVADEIERMGLPFWSDEKAVF